jgi:hypothetical protein
LVIDDFDGVIKHCKSDRNLVTSRQLSVPSGDDHCCLH